VTAKRPDDGGQGADAGIDAETGPDTAAENGAGADATPALRVAVAARPGQLAALRRLLREWLVRAKVNEQDASAVQIAVGEATTNAVEHAYVGTDPGLVRLTVRLGKGGVLSIQVSDLGRWRVQKTGPNRGRGLSMMRAVMDEVQVRRRHDGTTVLMRLALGRRRRPALT
jgi:anti-sigma regulatory factor (Ser/Thr protein kinase)